ncbi:MAG: hypothetical protein AAGE80_10920 [Pseudomonadota bacterium]
MTTKSTMATGAPPILGTAATALIGLGHLQAATLDTARDERRATCCSCP